MAIEIVDFPINSMVDLSIVFCQRLPEGYPFLASAAQEDLKYPSRAHPMGFKSLSLSGWWF